MSEAADTIAPLREFVRAMTDLVGRAPDEDGLIAEARPLLATLIRDGNWLPDEFARPHPEHYQQYLLHADPLERFSVVSFVWGPGQRTPVHDHTVWGLIGILRGAEIGTRWGIGPDGRFGQLGGTHRLEVGDVDVVSPSRGDIHQVSNAYDDRTSISIHVYGANIGGTPRHVFDPSGVPRDFVSGYSSPFAPNLWDRSQAVKAGWASRR